MRLTQIFAAAAIALVSTFAVADDAADKAIRKSLENLQLEVPVESITASPLPGLYEVKLKAAVCCTPVPTASTWFRATCSISRTASRST